MDIAIDSQQCEALRDLVERRLDSLSTEIRHTDSLRLRQELRADRELLRGLLNVLICAAA
jgi:hypothetical protein